ncbi:MAG TPA: NADH-ubiquinone oxidoreductase-F iron-sulfur binding region domain-containing protein [Thermomicrobiaceae bacterium]|nr:NADH-ubiquinone oxidoreductase-F iron-sulfur binding region domain-containing protein [Thermomicrobiaceae bacterium]
MTAAMHETRATTTTRRLLREPGMGRESLDDYLAAGGYAAAAWDHSPLELIDLVTASGLRGRGGAAFPTGRKLRSVAGQPGPRVVLINGAESEPASRKDHALLLTRPHLVIEGALLAARAVGSDDVILYTHDRALERVVAEARKELKRAGAKLPRWRTEVGPPGYVAGEASAAIQWINRRSARPTSKPPRTHERGVANRPTLVQNVETLANLPLIAREGAAWFRAVGSDDAPGTVLVTLSGGVRRPGVYEVPTGTPLRAILDDLGGGTPDGVQALLPGGYFAGWLPGAALRGNLTLDPTSLRAAGADLGSAAITVVPDSVCGLAQAARLLRFFADESARQCGACTFGTAAMADALERVRRGEERPDDLERLHTYAERMLPGRGACGHLDGAAVAARTALRVFADEIEIHRRRGTCGRPARIVLPGLEESHGR